MPRQSFIWTTLPNGYTTDGKSLRLSLLLSPRLDPEAAPKVLQTFFPAWADWPATLRSAHIEVTYNGKTVKLTGVDVTGANRIDGSVGLPDSAVWAAVFESDLPVTPFAFTDLSAHTIVSYDAMMVASLVQQLYAGMASSADGELPKITRIGRARGWREFIDAVEEIDRASVNEDTGLRDPSLQFRRLRGRNSDSTSLISTLERLQMFHTPMSTPKPQHQTRTDDPRIKAQWMEYGRTPLPAKADIAKQIDFHQVVAAMNSYPTLLRRLGLVIDLLLDASSFTPSAGAPLSAKVSFAAGTFQGHHQPRGAGPHTRTMMNNDRFQAVSAPTPAFGLTNGLLDLDPKRFGLLQFDVDGAGLKMMNFARTLGRRSSGDNSFDSVTRHEDQMGAPALRNVGLMLVHSGRSTYLQDRFDRNKTGNADLEGEFHKGGKPVVLYAQDLVRGYRIDVWDATTGKWQSLCRRSARYELDGGVVVQPEPEEESIVRLGATRSSDPASNPDLLQLHESLVSWAGWSLAAPTPGRAIQPDDSVDKSQPESEAEIPPGIHFKSSFRPVPRSLPRLRFGRAYAMRARAVDLAGNSLHPQIEDFGPEQPAVNAQPYLRYHPVPAPVIALLSVGGEVEMPAEGESMLRMAIRSFNDTPADNSVPTTQVAHRAAAPPRASIREAEQHGMLDLGGKVDSSTFSALANELDVDARDPSAAIRELKVALQSPTEGPPAETTFAVYEAGRALTYLPEPMALEVAVRIFDHPNIGDSEIMTVPLYTVDDWPKAQAFEVEVYDDPVAKPYFDSAIRRLRVPLPKGVRAKVRLSSALAPEVLPMMGIFGWLTAAQQAAQQDRAVNGQHWMLTPWTEIEVIHAVQRPLLSPNMFSLSVARDLNGTSARPVLSAHCSLNSTDHLDLLAEWHEPFDHANGLEAAVAPADRQRRDLAFTVKITDARSYAQQLHGESGGGYPDHTVSTQDVIGVNTITAAPNTPQLVTVKAHEFHDTRYRRIEYWMDATSRFREFLPLDLLTADQGGQRVPVDTKIKVTGERTVAWVPSSAAPPAPVVLYVLPTFGWSRTGDAGTQSSWRRGGGLRVYLDRPWNVSGYGEMLAVVLPPASFGADPETSPTGAPYKKYVTQWGNDPVWDSPSVAGISPRRADFTIARNAPDVTGAWLPPNAPETEKDQQPGPFTVVGLRPPRVTGSEAAIEVAPHDVFYDAERQLWYCDIQIDSPGSYFPFIRLALARYQPISVAGAHLSNVVLADFIALSADRWLNLTGNDSAARHVALLGFRPREGSGHHEAAAAPSLSTINVLTGEVQTLRPAELAKSTVVEVWVERLDPVFGEDFGWQRVEAMVTGGDPGAAPGVKPVGVLLGPELARTSILEAGTSTISGTAVTSPVLQGIGLLQLPETLWEGDVTLPAGDGHRRRLVVAEFEEYLVDSADPYGQVPTKKDRRMVYVEHVELPE